MANVTIISNAAYEADEKARKAHNAKAKKNAK
jgi:hypothetical protein